MHVVPGKAHVPVCAIHIIAAPNQNNVKTGSAFIGKLESCPVDTVDQGLQVLAPVHIHDNTSDVRPGLGAIGHTDKDGGEEVTAADLACLNPSPGGDDVVHPEFDLSIPEVARVNEVVEAADAVINDDAAKEIEEQDDEIETILFHQPNMIIEDHALPNKDSKPKAKPMPKAKPAAGAGDRFFDGPAMMSTSSTLPDSSPSATHWSSFPSGEEDGGKEASPNH